jgi:hypothetical protein
MYDELAQVVEDCLAQIAETTSAQLKAFQKSNHSKMMQSDKHLELMIVKRKGPSERCANM